MMPTAVLHRRRVPDLHRAFLRQRREIRVRAVEFAIEHHARIQMLEAARFATIPARDTLAVVFAILSDGVIGDRIKMLPIDGHALRCLIGFETAQFRVRPVISARTAVIQNKAMTT